MGVTLHGDGWIVARLSIAYAEAVEEKLSKDIKSLSLFNRIL